MIHSLSLLIRANESDVETEIISNLMLTKHELHYQDRNSKNLN